MMNSIPSITIVFQFQPHTIFVLLNTSKLFGNDDDGHDPYTSNFTMTLITNVCVTFALCHHVAIDIFFYIDDDDDSSMMIFVFTNKLSLSVSLLALVCV
jgi:hypothetical protein